MNSSFQRLGKYQRITTLSINSIVRDGKEPTRGIMLTSNKISMNDKVMTVVTKTVVGAKRREFIACALERMTNKERIFNPQFVISIAVECKCKPTISFSPCRIRTLNKKIYKKLSGEVSPCGKNSYGRRQEGACSRMPCWEQWLESAWDDVGLRCSRPRAIHRRSIVIVSGFVAGNLEILVLVVQWAEIQ